ncbi:MAG: hypothetical protein U9R75_03205, partial [Candidatus Thermoplasmatota archaeon]|nr:hypothetical protein [Candidatus Thermoplasmatota archaeon]
MDVPETKVMIIAHDREKTIASKILLLRYLVRDVCSPDIVVVDNGSTDRTTKLARRCGCRVIAFSKRLERDSIIRRTFEAGKKGFPDILVIIDVKGENPADDAASLIMQSVNEGSGFASAFVQSVKDDETIGCWAMSREIYEKMNFDNGEIDTLLLELARSENLRSRTVYETVEIHGKRKRTKY